MKLNLTERFLLLALDSNTGKFLIDSIALNHGLAGAALMQLNIMGKIHIENKRVVVADETPTGIKYYDKILALLTSSSRKRRVKFWVNRVGARLKRLKYKVVGKLIMQGVLREQQKKILGVFPYNMYPANNRVPKEQLKEELWQIIKGDREADLKSLVLISLLEATKLTRVLFSSKDQYKEYKGRIKELTKEFEGGELIRTPLKEVCASVIAASISASVGTSSDL